MIQTCEEDENFVEEIAVELEQHVPPRSSSQPIMEQPHLIDKRKSAGCLKFSL